MFIEKKVDFLDISNKLAVKVRERVITRGTSDHYTAVSYHTANNALRPYANGFISAVVI